MSVFIIKVLAVLFMFIDHTGTYFFQDIYTFRAIGRLSFPLFAWLIANGAYHTKNIDKYLKRLLIFGILSQIPYSMLNYLTFSTYDDLNIFFTLFLGLLCIKVWKLETRNFIKYFLIILILLFSYIFKVSYGSVGILSIFFFYIFYQDKRLTFISQTTIYTIIHIIRTLLIGKTSGLIFFIQPLAILSIPIINLYNGKPGIKLKYIFYLIYPIHFILIYLIKVYLVK